MLTRVALEKRDRRRPVANHAARKPLPTTQHGISKDEGEEEVC
jgi:hypothetical protein